MANPIQQSLVGAVSAAAAGTRGIESTFEKEDKQESKASASSKQAQVESATAKAQDSLAAARKQSFHRSHSNSMLKLMEAKRKAGK